MKRNSLTTAVIAGIAGVAGIASLANAVELNADGLGQVLVYPYYTVNAGQTTLLSVVNTTDEGKAVKVRFLEGYNSREVLDFNLFLSAFDVWTGAVFTNSATDAGNLTTDDNSCTAPAIKTGAGLPTTAGGAHYIPFRNFAFATSANDDGATQSITRTREGHIELIEMGAIRTDSTLYSRIAHAANGVPPGCASVQNLGPTGALAADIGHSVHSARVNTGGLFGAGSVVNPAIGTIAGYNADAVDGFYALDATSATAVSPLFFGTSSTSPSLANTRTTPASAVAFTFTTESSGGAPGGSLRTLTYPAPAQAIDAVSAVFQAATISNEYVVENASGSESDWIVTFPTKRFYVDDKIVGTTPIQPFEEVFDGQSCIAIGISYYNREEQVPASAPGDFSPPPPDRPPSSLCYEAQAVTFQTANDYTADGGVSKVLGSTLTSNVDPRSNGFSSGWMNLDLDPAGDRQLRASAELIALTGLPTTGFLAVNYVNANQGQGTLANYSGLFRHRASRECVNVTAGAGGVSTRAAGVCS